MKIPKSLISFLGLLVLVIWISVFSLPDDKLHLIACDVGQGDAILITYKNLQILTDGGPNSSVINCLSKHVPFWDRTIEVVILTNPDIDHYGGLMEVFKRYKVNYFVKSPTDDITQNYRVLGNIVGSSGASIITPTSGQSIVYDLMHLDIVFPQQPIDYQFKDPQNNYSSVSLLTFGKFKAILTGDIQDEASDYIANNIPIGKVDYIKVSHHGSKNGTSKSLLEVLRPDIAVISAGKNNKFGHPHQEVLNLLNEFNINIFRTDEMGDIEIVTNGDHYVILR